MVNKLRIGELTVKEATNCKDLMCDLFSDNLYSQCQVKAQIYSGDTQPRTAKPWIINTYKDVIPADCTLHYDKTAPAKESIHTFRGKRAGHW